MHIGFLFVTNLIVTNHASILSMLTVFDFPAKELTEK